MNKQITEITEDYCSYKTAKLLKEKGFKNEYCDNMLLAEDGDTIWKFATFTNKDDAFDATMKFKKQIPYVTHQLALKWLREVHNWYIDIRFNRHYQYYIPIVYNMSGTLESIANLEERPKQYEQAVEVAILYVLENLI